MKHKSILREFGRLRDARILPGRSYGHGSSSRSIIVERGDRFAEWYTRGTMGEEDVVDYIYVSTYLDEAQFNWQQDGVPGKCYARLFYAIAHFESYTDTETLHWPDGQQFGLQIRHCCRAEGRKLRYFAYVEVESGAEGGFFVSADVEEEGALFLRSNPPEHVLMDWLLERCPALQDIALRHQKRTVRVWDLPDMSLFISNKDRFQKLRNVDCAIPFGREQHRITKTVARLVAITDPQGVRHLVYRDQYTEFHPDTDVEPVSHERPPL